MYEFVPASVQVACMRLQQRTLGVPQARTCGLSNFYEACIAGKKQQKTFPAHRGIGSKRRLQLVHSDICGPMPTESISGNRYFVTFVDVYSSCY